MKKILLHIGTEKTGTTSLQTFFSLNKKSLSAADIWYPDSEKLDYCHRHGHFPLAAATLHECPDFVTPKKHFKPIPIFKGLLADFEARKESTLLLSAEHFSSRCSKRQKLFYLRALLKSYPVQIIVYVRPQHELLLSAYSTFLKSGGKKTLEEVSRDRWLKTYANYFNYYNMLSGWWKVFGDENVTVRIFQKEQMPEGDLYRDFMEVLGVNWKESLLIPERQNPPISKELADFLYLANQKFPAFIEKDRAGWELGQQFRTEVADLFPNGRPLSELLSDSLKEECKSIFAEYNTELANRARPDLDGVLFQDESEEESADSTSGTTENYFKDEFVTWVIDQWRPKRPSRLRKLKR